MAESTCLHIQDHESGPIRIVEIPWISVRIGRAAFCEVRLTDPLLADEACRLHRRGRTWHVTPVSGTAVSVEDVAIEGSRPLPFDVPFRVGPYHLSLKRNKFAEPDWRHPRSTPTVDAPSVARPRPEHPVHAPIAETGPQTPEPTLNNPWEARWKAAGDRLKAAAAKTDQAEAVKPRAKAPAPSPPPTPAPAVAPKAETFARPRPAPAPAVAPNYPSPFKPASRFVSKTTAEPTPASPRIDESRKAARVPFAEPVRGEALPTWVPKTEPRPTIGYANRERTTAEPTPAVPRIDENSRAARVPFADPRPPIGYANGASTNKAAWVPFAAPVSDQTVAAEPIAIEAVEVETETDAKPLARLNPTIDPRAKADFLARLENLDLDSIGEFVVKEPVPKTPEAPVAEPEPEPEPELLAEVETEIQVQAEIVVEAEALEAPVAEPEPELLAEVETEVQAEIVVEAEAEPIVEVVECQSHDDAVIEDEAESLPDEPGDWTYSPATEPAPYAEDHEQRFVADTSYTHHGGDLVYYDDEPDQRDAPSRAEQWAEEEAARLERQERERFQDEAPPRRRPQVQPQAQAQAQTGALWKRESTDEDDVQEPFDPTRSRRSRSDRPGARPALPSVQDVLDASLWRHRQEAAVIARPRQRVSLEVIAPTTAREPALWSPPVWLAWPPAVMLTLAVGAVFTVCSWWQAVDSYNASVAIQSAVAVRQGHAKDRPLAKSVVPPSMSWWRTTPLHLAEWGVYLNGTRVDHGWSESSSELIDGAAAISPLSPLVRLAKSRQAEVPGSPTTPTMNLGLSRDAVSLAWSARLLHKAGKDQASVQAYRRALEIAARTKSTPDSPLTFNDDPNVPRYLLPGEAAAAAIVRELVADASWAYSDWSEAIPEANVSTLAAARVLKEQGRSEADAVLKRIIEKCQAEMTNDGDGQTDPVASAVRHAVAAEALALRANWKEAEQHYRAAIDLMSDARVKRSWWFNLADVAAHLNDETQRRAALDEALAVIDGDDVSRRAVDLQRVAGRSNRLRSNGTKAN